jgi:integrin alpha FG-GAP repeat containing protein 1
MFVLNADQRSISLYSWNRGEPILARRGQSRRLKDFCLAKYAFEAVQGAKAVTAPFVITNVVPGDYDYDGRLDMLLMGQDNPGGWWADEELHMSVHIGQGRGQFGRAPLFHLHLAAAKQATVRSCAHDNTFICNTATYAV